MWSAVKSCSILVGSARAGGLTAAAATGVDVVGLQSFHGDERKLLLDVRRAAVRAGGFLPGRAHEEFTGLPAGGAMKVENRHS